MTARLRADLRVTSLKRIVEARGDFFTIVKQGHPEAGVIHVIVGHRGAWTLISEGAGGWVLRLETTARDEIDRTLEREARFDPDHWAIEIEGRLSLDDLAAMI
ncbi:DUF1491 family protein [Parvularcula bermudensis]|uniref:DUF1491 family protein n=1 Tax=Parvularcula bermudensis TaxID=208216 RepID=UPI000322CDB2|nr:DUF1491 family protein [Parvularcula bermudensis]